MASGGTTVTQTVEEPESKKPTGKNVYFKFSFTLNMYCQVVIQPKTPSLPGQISPENLDMSNITEVNISNVHNSELA